MKVEESIIIKCSPEEVFGFFDNRENDKRWMASVLESEWLDPSAVTGVGRHGRMVMNVMGRREFVDEVTGYQHGRMVSHRSRSGAMVIHTACIVEPAEDRCRVTITYEPERLPGGILGWILAPITSRIVRLNYRADLVRLKAILE